MDSTTGEYSEENETPTRGFPVIVQNSYASNLESSALQKMAFDSDFAEDINMKMRIPQKLTVGASQNDSNSTTNGYIPSQKHGAYEMEVPERIVVSVGEDGARYGRSNISISRDDLYGDNFPQRNPNDLLSLTTPPRKLTLEERDLDTLDIQDSQQDISVTKSETSHKSKESVSDVLMGPVVPAVHNESMEELDDVSVLRRQVFKLHHRITSIEKQQEEKSKRDLYVYAVTIAFWFINGWFLYSSRRPY
ncbi:mitochondrial fission factor-like isoform X2 [Styela clava]